MEKSLFKRCIMIFLFFFKIGFFTFGGGWGILAQMEQEFITKRKLMTKDDLLEMVAVGKSVPGIMITNVSTLFGYQLAGIPGGICAFLGIAAPAMIVLTIVTYCYDLLKDNYWAAAALKGIGSSVVPIIGSAALSLSKDVFRRFSGILICIVAFPFCYFTSISNIILVVVGVIIALIWMGIDLRIHPQAAENKDNQENS